MALETATGDYLSGRETKRLYDEVCEGIFRELRGLPMERGRELLAGVRSALEQEITAEERFQKEFSGLQEELLRVATTEELARRHGELAELVAAFFARRESAIAFHELCTTILDTTVSQALRLAEGELTGDGFGAAPVYAWLVIGPPGRRETTLSPELESLIVHEPGGDAAAYCTRLTEKTVGILERCGFRKNGRGITPDDPAWRASLEAWQERVEQLCRRSSGTRVGTLPVISRDDILPRRITNLSTYLFELADLRVAAGDAGLGGKMIALVRAAAERHPACIQEAAHTVAALPAPFTFLGNFRVERSGPHRGRVDLGRWARLPLVSMVRLQAVTGGVAATGTLERVQILLRRGTFDVELGKRLLQGGLEIFRLMARLELQEGVRGDGAWLFPDSLSPPEEQALRDALEAVTTLQKVIHSSLASQG